jgi:peptide/nickel transport system permease protein
MRVLRAFLRAPGGGVSLISVAALGVVALVAPVILGGPATTLDMLHAAADPGRDHFLGTDALGRDIVARTLVASKLSLSLAVATTLLAAGIGVPLGAVVSLLGRRTRSVFSRALDAALSFPSILVAIFVTAIIGPSATAAVLGVGIAYSPQFARIVNTLAASAAGQEYVASARILGVRWPRLLYRHIVPNIAETIVIVTFVSVGDSIITVSSLSFLGLGVQPPDFDWGQMLTQGVQALYVAPLAALAPALMIAGTGLSAGLIGEAVARALNPILWTTHARSRRRTEVHDRTPENAPIVPPNGRDALRDAPLVSLPEDVLLHVDGLSVTVPTDGGVITPVDQVSFDLRPGEVLGIVGESGSGKTMTALAIAQLVPYPATIAAGALVFRGQDLLHTSRRQRTAVLSTELAMVFQDPMSSLNPALRMQTQLTEATRIHRHVSGATARRRASELLREVGISAPETRMRQYPHEFSGGMRQRATIAMALMIRPSLIIADEPTTSLDVTIQAQIVDVLLELNRVHGTAIILISHDLALISQTCHRALVMYAGSVVEDIPIHLLGKAAHPYTQALMASVPNIAASREQPLAAIKGSPPDLHDLPAGCRFAPRCPVAVERSHTERPPLERFRGGRRVACWVARERFLEVGARE